MVAIFADDFFQMHSCEWEVLYFDYLNQCWPDILRRDATLMEDKLEYLPQVSFTK